MSSLNLLRLHARAKEQEAVAVAQTRARKYIPHDPTERQKLFLGLPHYEAFYGGAAGGGKSEALLMAALEYADVPGYSALILRRAFTDLAKPGALMDRAHAWLAKSGAKWNEQKKQWRFASGAVLAFGYLENDTDVYQYQSAEFQFIAFDELTQFSDRQYTYLFSRLRRLANSDVPLRMRAASNPGGIGAGWVQARFIPDDWLPEQGRELRVIEKEGRAFVPAKLVDNPHLDRASYAQSLANLDEVTRAQLLEGDWQIRERGNVFPMWSDGPIGHHVITWSEFEVVYGVRAIPDHWERAIGHDWGSTDGHPAVVSVVARSAANSAIPGLYFLYYGRTFKQSLVDDVAETLSRELSAEELANIKIWRMSHEAKSERDTYRAKYGLPFAAMRSGKTEGIAQMRHLLSLRETAKPHPFRAGVSGHPLLLCVVADGELLNPKTDAGLERHRGEFAAYRYTETPATVRLGQAQPIPYKWFDDAMDSLRGMFCEWGPGITPLTEFEETELALPETMRIAQVMELPPTHIDFALIKRDYLLGKVKRERRATAANWSHEIVDPASDPLRWLETTRIDEGMDNFDGD